MVHVTWPHPFWGWFAVGGLAFATIILSTKFEVSIFTRHEDVTGDTKCRKWGGLGVVMGHSRSLKTAIFDRVHTS